MLYLNPESAQKSFSELRRSPYFVDKSGLIAKLIPSIGVPEKYICITRPRRFGKTTNAQMVAAFLSRSAKAATLFEGLDACKDEDALRNLGAHDVIYIDFSLLPDNCSSYQDYISRIKNGIINDLRKAFPEAGISPESRDLFEALASAFDTAGKSFCFVMDEWDSMFFNSLFTEEDQKAFLMFLKQLLKTKPYVEFAYMTGILPIAKHSTGSELNMFVEYSAVDDPRYERFFGFTEDEVRELCVRHAKRKPNARVNYEELARWYDGYLTEDGEHRFNPRSVVLALVDDRLRSYWTESGPYDEIYYYVKNNIAAVRDDLVRMVAGETVRANMKNYAATYMSLTTKDEIFSAMATYGFLTYYDGEVRIPNHELMLKFQEVLSKEDMGYVARLAQRSEAMLDATLRGDTETMAEIISAAHDQEVPLLRYANEADLAALVNLVYLAARDRYAVRREEPAGRGIADVVFAPNNPADTRWRPFVVELKANGTTAEALAQIRKRNYGAIFSDGLLNSESDRTSATGSVAAARSDGSASGQRPLAVAIVWDAKSKIHECAVEEW